MQEYNHVLNTARRLALSHDLVLASKPPPGNLVTAEDLVVYIRWLVFYQHVTKNVTSFVAVSGGGGGGGSLVCAIRFSGQSPLLVSSVAYLFQGGCWLLALPVDCVAL